MTEQDKRAIKALCFPDATEERRAYQCAEDIRRLPKSSPWIQLDLDWLRSSPGRLGLVADALKETTRFQPNPTCLNIVTAWHQAFWGRKGASPADMMSGPTFREVVIAYIELFVPEKQRPPDWRSRKELAKFISRRPFRHNVVPSRQAFKKTRDRLSLWLRRDKVGPPSSK